MLYSLLSPHEYDDIVHRC